jgi:hypothetical protein
MTIGQNARYSRLLVQYGKREETQGHLENETVDQEVGGSNPPSCTSEMNNLVRTCFPKVTAGKHSWEAAERRPHFRWRRQ